MPVFSDEVITPEQKRDVIAYIEQIDKTPRYGGFAMGSMGPVSEGMFAWIVGIGSLVGVATWIAAHTARSTKQKAES
jgi:ubiquinol-cytochrome c reductase cytochrome c subunit